MNYTGSKQMSMKNQPKLKAKKINENVNEEADKEQHGKME